MTPEVAVDLFRNALWLTTMMVAVLVIPSLLVGLLVAMFQAATQINEQTLSFLPRLLVMLKRYDAARDAFQRLRTKYPKQAEAAYAVGVLSYELKDYDEAERKDR